MIFPIFVPCKLLFFLQVSSRAVFFGTFPLSPTGRLCNKLLMVPFVLILHITLHFNDQSTRLSSCQAVTFAFICPASLHFNLGWILSALWSNFTENTQKLLVELIKVIEKNEGIWVANDEKRQMMFQGVSFLGIVPQTSLDKSLHFPGKQLPY